MIKRSVVLFCLMLLVVSESALFSFLPMEFSKPDVGIPSIIYATFFLGPVEGLVTAFLFGFTQELLSSGPHGALLFTKIFIFVSCIFLRSKLYIESQYLFALVSTVLVLVESILFVALAFFAKGETGAIVTVLKFCLPNGVFTGVVALFLFPVLERLKLKPYAGV
jgi:cell shape-determining protein MreD